MSTAEEQPQGVQAALRLSFDQGTIVVEGLPEGEDGGLPGLQFDHRTRQHRAPGLCYRPIVQELLRQKIPYLDAARDYQRKAWPLRADKAAFPHQTEALEAWVKADKRGVVVLPTGTGKTYLANMAIEK